MTSTAEKRRAVAALAAERDARGSRSRTLKRCLAVLLALLLIAFPSLWALGFFSSPRAVAEVRQLVDRQVLEYERIARGEVPYESAPSFGPMMEKMRDLPREQREQVGPEMGRLFQARERAELASYFRLPPADRQAELDRRIKAEEERRKAWQAEREKRNQQQAGAGGPGGDRGGDRGGGGANTGGGRPGGGRTEEGRNDRSKRRIDQSTPEQRAQATEYRRAMDVRRTQLGLPAGGRRGG